MPQLSPWTNLDRPRGPLLNRPRQQVSTRGGITPVWSRDGARLSYRSETHLMAVDVSHAPQLAVSLARPVLPDTYGRPLPSAGSNTYVVRCDPDGHFTFVRPVSSAASLKPTVYGVLNWMAGLR
jgi:hypothetical protein